MHIALLMVALTGAMVEAPAAPRPPAGVVAATVATQVGNAVVAGAALAASAAVGFARFGQPKPGWVAGSTGLAFAVMVGLDLLVTPAVLEALQHAPASAVRAAALRLSWPALVAGGLGVGALAVGAALEEARFGAGQGWLLVGLTTALVSALAQQVLYTLGSLADPKAR